MGEQCKARHPATGLRCERNDDHNHKALASERGTHRAELPPERPGFATTQPVVRVVSW
jgi:hypothetical protein